MHWKPCQTSSRCSSPWIPSETQRNWLRTTWRNSTQRCWVSLGRWRRSAKPAERTVFTSVRGQGTMTMITLWVCCGNHTLRLFHCTFSSEFLTCLFFLLACYLISVIDIKDSIVMEVMFYKEIKELYGAIASFKIYLIEFLACNV